MVLYESAASGFQFMNPYLPYSLQYARSVRTHNSRATTQAGDRSHLAAHYNTHQTHTGQSKSNIFNLLFLSNNKLMSTMMKLAVPGVALLTLSSSHVALARRHFSSTTRDAAIDDDKDRPPHHRPIIPPKDLTLTRKMQAISEETGEEQLLADTTMKVQHAYGKKKNTSKNNGRSKNKRSNNRRRSNKRSNKWGNNRWSGNR